MSKAKKDDKKDTDKMSRIERINYNLGKIRKYSKNKNKNTTKELKEIMVMVVDGISLIMNKDK